ncbi:MAG: 5-methylcytosine restriction system specificity protein McrC [Bacillota bacterium]
MSSDQKVLIKNIYYMLSYAFRVLRQSAYDHVSVEEFEHVHDLLAAILSIGMSQQVKQGLYREYVVESDSLPLLRGRLDMRGTMRNRLQLRQQLACEYDELSVNNIFNQILKTTAFILLGQPTVKPERKAALKRVLLFFDGVDLIEPAQIRWSTLRYTRLNQSYEMLLNVCHLVLEGLLLSTQKGQYKLADFLRDLNLARLYEKFVLEYYRYHYPELRPAASQIAWNLDDGVSDFLPIMQTDVTLRDGRKTLIIDAKFYSSIMQIHPQYDSRSLHIQPSLSDLCLCEEPGCESERGMWRASCFMLIQDG